MLLDYLQGLHGQLLQQALSGVPGAEVSLDAASLPLAVREAAFVEAADCFAALIAKPQVRTDHAVSEHLSHTSCA